MCGIVGMAGNLNYAQVGMFKDMMLFSTVRGMDSAGVVFVGLGKDDKPKVQKALGHPGNLFSDGKVFDNKGRLDRIPKVVIGHTRFATQGEVNVENAHPFEFDHIAGVHNGSLSVWHELDGYKEETVDSRAIFRTINNRGIEETWKSFVGPAALVWWDSKEDTLNLVRNNERDLYVAHSEKGDAIFWASELWMITVAAMRANVKLRFRKDEENNTSVLDSWKPKEHVLHTYKPTASDIELEEVKTLEKKTFTSTGHSGGENQSMGYWGQRTGVGFKGRSGLIVPRVRHGSSANLNLDWAVNADRTDKSYVGTEFVMDYAVDIPLGSTSPDAGKKCFVGHMEDGTRVEIFPPTTKEWNEWQDTLTKSYGSNRFNSPSSRTLLTCKFTSRPRMGNQPDGKPVIKIASDCISVVGGDIGKKLLSLAEDVNNSSEEKDGDNVIPFTANANKKYLWKGSWVNGETWMNLLKQTVPDCNCVWCASPITLEDAGEVDWVGRTDILCGACAGDAAVRTEIRTMINS